MWTWFTSSNLSSISHRRKQVIIVSLTLLETGSRRHLPNLTRDLARRYRFPFLYISNQKPATPKLDGVNAWISLAGHQWSAHRAHLT